MAYVIIGYPPYAKQKPIALCVCGDEKTKNRELAIYKKRGYIITDVSEHSVLTSDDNKLSLKEKLEFWEDE